MPSLYSTLLLTVLLAIGLLFFIRASIKERTETLRLPLTSPDLPHRVRQHLQSRGYRLIQLDGDRETAVFEGEVRFSLALLLLLCILSGIGTACLQLVLSVQLPELWQANWGSAGIAIAMLSTGIFYARGAHRKEQVKLVAQAEDHLLIIGHRDELRQLQRSLNL